jgi:hypothetical protein
MRKVIAALSAVLALFVIACEGEGVGEDRGPGKFRTQVPNPQPDPVEADPGGPHKTHTVLFTLSYTGSKEGRGEYTLARNSKAIPFTPRQPVWDQRGQKWQGSWEKEFTSHGGATVGFTYFGKTAGNTWTMCYLKVDGVPQDYQIGSGNCAVSHTIAE